MHRNRSLSSSGCGSSASAAPTQRQQPQSHSASAGPPADVCVRVSRPPPPSPKPPSPRPPPPRPPPSPPPPPPVGNVFELVTLNMSMGAPQGFVYCGCGWVTGLLTGSVTVGGRPFLSTLGVVCRYYLVGLWLRQPACLCPSELATSKSAHATSFGSARCCNGPCPEPAATPPPFTVLPAPTLPACSNGETFQDPAYATIASQTQVTLQPTQVGGPRLVGFGADQCIATWHELGNHLRCPGQAQVLQNSS